ncbi:MAG: outer membrane protein assembly factor BamA, partial [Arcobacteraceae bacterium]
MYKKSILLLIISLNIFAAENYKTLEFKGLTQISNEVALETTMFKNKTYTQAQINDAIKKFYKFDYFTNIFVTQDNDNLVFNFEEKPFIAKLEMTGYKNRDDELKFLYSNMGIKKGTMYTQEKMKKAKKAL